MSCRADRYNKTGTAAVPVFMCQINTCMYSAVSMRRELLRTA